MKKINRPEERRHKRERKKFLWPCFMNEVFSRIQRQAMKARCIFLLCFDFMLFFLLSLAVAVYFSMAHSRCLLLAFFAFASSSYSLPCYTQTWKQLNRLDTLEKVSSVLKTRANRQQTSEKTDGIAKQLRNFLQSLIVMIITNSRRTIFQ